MQCIWSAFALLKGFLGKGLGFCLRSAWLVRLRRWPFLDLLLVY